MAYFPDLSRYAYGRHDEIEGGRLDLNVGWLSRDREFTRGPAPRGLQEALLRCATRPVRLYRGSHVCDICPATGSMTERVARMEVDGRDVTLGNGEIRVEGSDGRWYTAPTLIAHYVAMHDYLPPSPFIDGVMTRAATIYVPSGEQLRRLLAASFQDQLRLGLRVLDALPTRSRDALEALRPKILASVTGESCDEIWRYGWRDSRGSRRRRDGVLSACRDDTAHDCRVITAPPPRAAG